MQWKQIERERSSTEQSSREGRLRYENKLMCKGEETIKQLNDSDPQVNNATARVVTKKPQTPLVNGELPSQCSVQNVTL